MSEKNKSNSKVKVISTLSDILGILSFITMVIPSLTAIISGIFPVIILVIPPIIIFARRQIIARKFLGWIMNCTCPDKTYKLKKKEIIYEFKSREEMRLEKNFDAVVLHDGFTGVYDKFKWTGDGDLIPQPKRPALHKIEMLEEKYGMKRYQIKFKDEQNYSKGDDVDTIGMVIENIQDKQHKSSLRLLSGVFEITDCLELHLIFDKDLKPKNIRELEYIHYSDDEHYRCENVNYVFNDSTEKKEVIWTINKPIYGGKYVIDWVFDN